MVWTDTLQFVVMIGSILGVFYQGVNSVGGFGEVWKRADESKRLDFDFDMDPTKGDTVFATSIGSIFIGLCYAAINQSFVQKFLSLPSRKDIKM